MPEREVPRGCLNVNDGRTIEERMGLLMSTLLDVKMEMAKLGRELQEKMVKEVDKQIESKERTIDARLALREAVKLKQLLVDKRVITQAEFETKLKE